MNKKWQSFKKSVAQIGPFISPYKWSFFIAIGMIIITNIVLAITPTIEGQITSLLMENALAIADKVPGAHIQFDIVIKIIVTFFMFYMIKTISQLIFILILISMVMY